MTENTTHIKEKRGTAAMNRYGVIVFLLLVIFAVILGCIFHIKYSEGETLRALGDSLRIKKDYVILPKRGNIYAADGRLLATSEPLYEIYIDFLADGIRKDTLDKYIDGMSTALERKFPEKTAKEYKNFFLDGWKLSRNEKEQINKAEKTGGAKKIRTRSRHLRLLRRSINYLELKELRTFPYLSKKSNANGLIAEEKAMRKKPFGRLAGRTVGSIYKDIAKGGSSGIEQKYDSLLRGEPGIKNRQKVQREWIDIVEKPARDGLDIKTTIDVDIQDIAERALYAKLSETEAESGCAVIMEVESGEIKGISNLDRITGGKYAEGNPNVFSYMSEPGSTFKTASIMVALEDGVITPQDSFYVGTGLYDYEYMSGGAIKTRTIRDHYWGEKRDRGWMTVAEGMYHSSNIVIAKAVLKGYKNDRERYVNHLYKLGITKELEWDVPLKGIEGKCIIRHPSDNANPWSAITLPWMSFGYETKIPPIYMLMLYNGIANHGKMLKPFIVKAFLKDGKPVEEFEAEVVNPSLCSDRTLRQIQDMLVGVVNKGTAAVVGENLPFQVAGKTGTALIASKGGYSGYYVSFCGYFPADKPKYTCFVGIRRPKGYPSGGKMAGMVFKNIAEEVYANNVRLSPESHPKDSDSAQLPHAKNGACKKLATVLSELNLKFNIANTESRWVKANVSRSQIELTNNIVTEGIVPDVAGMGARDALYLLEKSGLKVGLSGCGKVTAQSIAAGSRLVKGSYIEIRLN
jgi:cell division protein FtsI (penicillin-binding protein 3)